MSNYDYLLDVAKVHQANLASEVERTRGRYIPKRGRFKNKQGSPSGWDS